MAKSETNTRRQTNGNWETTAQRRERERKRWAIDQIANWIVWRINSRRLAQQIESDPELKFIHRLCANRDTWMESESIENIANGLRLAADRLEGKPRDGRTFSAHNSQIVAAVLEAGARVARYCPRRTRVLDEVHTKDSIHRFIWGKPTFSEILSVYREQNPGTKVEGRTLRRILKRLHFPTFPSKRGRPKGKSNLL
jgi:hypothetical protein